MTKLKAMLIASTALLHSMPDQSSGNPEREKQTAENLSAAPEPRSNSVAISSFAANARHLGEQAKETDKEVETTVQADEDVKRGPVATFFALVADYGMEVVSSFPRPGTNDKQGDEKWDNNPETRSESVPKESGDGTRTQSTNFYTEFASGVPKIARWQWEADQLTITQKKDFNPETDITAEFKKAFPGWNDPSAVKSRKAVLTQRITKGRSYIRRAAALYHKIADLENLGTVKIDWDTVNRDKDADGYFKPSNLKRTGSPIIIEDNANPRVWRALDATRVLQIDIDKASSKEGGPTWENLMSSMGRGANKGGAVTTEAMPKSVDASIGTINGLTTFYNPETPEGEQRLDQFFSLARSKKEETRAFYLDAASALFMVAARIHEELGEEIKNHERAKAHAQAKADAAVRAAEQNKKTA